MKIRKKGIIGALGSTVVRLDPGTFPFSHAQSLTRHASGGELNVLANLAWSFGLGDAVMFTALPKGDPNAEFVDREIRSRGVRPVYREYPTDEVNGPKIACIWSDQGYGGRKPVVKYDRANEAGKFLRPGDFDWAEEFSGGVRWFHSGGIFASLSPTTAELILEAFKAARRSGAVTSFDLNYRAKLVRAAGLEGNMVETLRRIVSFTDVLVGNEEDLQLGLGIKGPEVGHEHAKLDPSVFEAMMEDVRQMFPNLHVVATSLRDVKTTNLHGWSGVLWMDGQFYQAPVGDIQVFDRVGGGDAFASGLFYGLIQGMGPQDCISLARAAGACKVTYPGDWLMGKLPEIQTFLGGAKPRVDR